MRHRRSRCRPSPGKPFAATMGDEAEHDHAAVNVRDGATPGAPASAALIDDLVVANHILFDQGVVDAFGHISVRHDKDPARFLLARNMAPGPCHARRHRRIHARRHRPSNANGRKVYLERFIHGEIFRRHPRVAAVVHRPFACDRAAQRRERRAAAGLVSYGGLCRTERAGVRNPRLRRRRHGSPDQQQRIRRRARGNVRRLRHRADARPRIDDRRRFDHAKPSTAPSMPR